MQEKTTSKIRFLYKQIAKFTEKNFIYRYVKVNTQTYNDCNV